MLKSILPAVQTVNIYLQLPLTSTQQVGMQNLDVNVMYLRKDSQIYKWRLTSFMGNINRASNSRSFKRLKPWWCHFVTSCPSIDCTATSLKKYNCPSIAHTATSLKKYSQQENPLDSAYNSYWLSQQFSQGLEFSTTKELLVLLEITHAKWAPSAWFSK